MFLRRICCLVALGWACAATGQPLSFALFGDTPYSRLEREQLPAMLAAMGRDKLAFAVHAGDIKNGSSHCSDEVFLDMLGLFQAAPLPLVYVPGDNEWTDCHRANNGPYDPLERLTRLRELFFQSDDTLGARPFRLERQSRDPAYAAYRENVRWEQRGALFVGLNLPGSENNYHGTRGSGGPVAEFIERSEANRVWLAQAFALARVRRLAGVLIVVQGNPGFEAARAGQPRPGYRDFIAQLRKETEAYAGQVVLVHGDTHRQQINQPLFDEAGQKVLGNFTRVEIYGSPFMGWVQGTLDPASPTVFSFTPHRWSPAPAASSP
ncbi:MAG: metallophosphoesterase [Burkholderiales bacterium]|nr:metallophosphoesterase [Burkholderiales bacterium]